MTKKYILLEDIIREYEHHLGENWKAELISDLQNYISNYSNIRTRMIII